MDIGQLSMWGTGGDTGRLVRSKRPVEQGVNPVDPHYVYNSSAETRWRAERDAKEAALTAHLKVGAAEMALAFLRALHFGGQGGGRQGGGADGAPQGGRCSLKGRGPFILGGREEGHLKVGAAEGDPCFLIG